MGSTVKLIQFIRPSVFGHVSHCRHIDRGELGFVWVSWQFKVDDKLFFVVSLLDIAGCVYTEDYMTKEEVIRLESPRWKEV